MSTNDTNGTDTGDPSKTNGSVEPIDTNDDGTVGLVKYVKDSDGDEVEQKFAATEAVDPDLLIEFAERCKENGWDNISMHVKEYGDFCVFASEYGVGAPGGYYVALAPVIPDAQDGDVDG